ncbi:tetratricopeptide repeat protein [Winogradskyella immobilis]|uniref:Tetratricopeptide repeat protein n=1 Tax=Winogradskyella immobilis TaxID=2816852 RepID=A0ABS8ENR6_9FLAO|nr:tetratricopeptide repeat protein [Winogradskyella immobilis]MCC1484869.1 tetratricopeptide repeat protein [Winogradskyella immobilis]MCG0016961.1 tetratricopeptide repeat protein [Winogradskyella immobilis]
MKTQSFLTSFLLALIMLSCNSVEFTEEFKAETSGKYLYNADDVIEVYYKGNDLYLKWREGEMKSVTTGDNEFFVADMYKKLHFVENSSSKEKYLSVIQEENTDSITYDYLKVADDYKTPSTYLKEANYEKALEGFLKIKEKDSTSEFIQQYKFNRIGYRFLRDKKHEDAVAIFKMNTILHPNSPNVYDSLGDGYLATGDSLNAYNNYLKSYDLNSRNKRAKEFIEIYEAK